MFESHNAIASVSTLEYLHKNREGQQKKMFLLAYFWLCVPIYAAIITITHRESFAGVSVAEPFFNTLN